MVHSLTSNIRFVGHYFTANLLGALEYRVSFFSQVVSMIMNDAMWVTFWWIYFTRFQVLQGGWHVGDVLTLWCVAALAFGAVTGVFGNVLRLAEIISQGKLDYYLSLPRNVLLHVLVSHMDVSAWGDMIFGLGLFAIFVHPSADRIVLFVVLSICGGTVFLAFNIFWQSLAFWLGNSEGLASQMWNALLMFATYQSPLFRGFVKVLLFTIIPTAFFTYIPVDLLREFDVRWLGGEIAFALGLLALAVFFFYRGLRRYESGNLMTARS